MRQKPIPLPPETTAFKQGSSMSEQLRKEKDEVERSAIARRATKKELQAPIIRVKKEPGKYEAFSIKLPNDLAQMVRDAAKVRKLTNAGLIRVALQIYLEYPIGNQ